jgi:hypothetical protein
MRVSLPVSLLGCLVPVLGCSAHTQSAPALKVPAVVRPACTGQFSGPGARPISRTTVANWYVRNGDLVYLIFLRGTPGWYDRKTSWKFGEDSTGRFVQNFDVGGFRYDLILDRTSTSLSILDTQIDLSKANIALIDKSEGKTFLRGSEMLSFCWTSPPDVAAEVLERSPASLKFVSAVPDAAGR